MSIRCLASRISYLTVLDLWVFFVTKLTKNFPSRANLGKIDSQLWWWLCIRVGWCPWKDDDWCYSRRSRLKNNQRRDVQGLYRARTPIRLVHSKQSPAAESAFSIFLQKKVTNFSLTCWDQVACLFSGLKSKKSFFYVTSVTRPTDVRIEPQA